MNKLNGNNTLSVVSEADNAQIEANMNFVYNLLGDDTQDEAAYAVELEIAA